MSCHAKNRNQNKPTFRQAKKRMKIGFPGRRAQQDSWAKRERRKSYPRRRKKSICLRQRQQPRAEMLKVGKLGVASQPARVAKCCANSRGTYTSIYPFIYVYVWEGVCVCMWTPRHVNVVDVVVGFVALFGTYFHRHLRFGSDFGWRFAAFSALPRFAALLPLAVLFRASVLPLFRSSVSPFSFARNFLALQPFPLVSLRSIFAIFSPFLPSSTLSCTDFAPLSLASSIFVIANFDGACDFPKITVITFSNQGPKG